MRSLPVGALAAAIVMFCLGFLFYGLAGMQMFSPLSPEASAALQAAVGGALTESGTYAAPGDEEAWMRGPSAIVNFIAAGDAPQEMTAMAMGFGHFLVSALLLALTLKAIGGDSGRQVRVVLWIGLTAAFFMHLGDPIWYGFGWRSSLFAFVADGVMLTAGGLVLAMWFTSEKPTPSA